MSRRHEELLEAGWIRRSIACEPRLAEILELYETLGFETYLKPLDDGDFEDGCRVCYGGDRERFRVVYTKETKKAGDRAK